MPGQYDPNTRTITLNTELDQEPILTTATLIHLAASDLLHAHNFPQAHFPELIDLTVVATGLGVLRSQIRLVNSSGLFWDTTAWESEARPFLDEPSLAYAYAVGAWLRDDLQWLNSLPPDIKKRATQSLKYLTKTNDCILKRFLDAEAAPKNGTARIDSPSISEQLIALHQFPIDQPISDAQVALLISKLASANQDIQLHAIAATESMEAPHPGITEELRTLMESREAPIRAKAMLALARFDLVDETTIPVAARMLESNPKYVSYAGLVALATRDGLPTPILTVADRRFTRALQTCDFEFISLFSGAYTRWVEDPETHFKTLFEGDSPEYLEMAMEALANFREHLVAID